MTTLKGNIIRLAHSKPELREHLLPLFREASEPTTREFLAELNNLISTASRMADKWTEDADFGYPKEMPDFDEHIHDLMAWRDAVKKRAKKRAEI